jgi:hypothetical protein
MIAIQHKIIKVYKSISVIELIGTRSIGPIFYEISFKCFSIQHSVDWIQYVMYCYSKKTSINPGKSTNE